MVVPFVVFVSSAVTEVAWVGLLLHSVCRLVVE